MWTPCNFPENEVHHFLYGNSWVLIALQRNEGQSKGKLSN